MKKKRETAQKKFRIQDSLSYQLIIKISLVFCAVFLILFFIVLWTNYRLIMEEEKQMFHSYETNVLQSIDDKLKDMCRVSLMSMADDETLDIICDYEEMDLYSQLKAEQYLKQFYGSLIAIRQDISGIYLLNQDSLIFHQDPCDASVKKQEKGEIQERIAGFEMETMKLANCSLTIEEQPFFMRLNGEYEKNPYLKNCIWMMRDISTFSPFEKVGTIILTAPVDTLRSLCLRSLDTGMEYLLTTESGKIICSENAAYILKNVSELNLQMKNQAWGTESHVLKWEGKWYLISRTQSQNSGLVLYSGKTISSIAGKILGFLKYYLFLTAAALLCTVFITAGYVKHIIHPISYLADEMESFDAGKLSVRYPVTTKDETGRLIAAFNKMMDMIHELIEKEYISQMQIKESKITEQRLRMLYLKSQINPHFLYNTLDTIRISAQLNQNEMVSEMLLQLVNFFRLSVKKNDSVVTLEHEMDLLCAYLKLMQYRYPEFSYEIAVEEELMEIEIPNFVLQPVVENSLMHGLRNKGYKGHISISVARMEMQEDIIEIRIEDNGIGFNAETKKRVERLLNLDEEQSLNRLERENIGIRNVQSRLKLFYPDVGGLRYCSRADEGISAVIHIRREISNVPCMEKDETDIRRRL